MGSRDTGLVTGCVVLSVLAGFWFGIVRPHLDRKVAELIDASREIEPESGRVYGKAWKKLFGSCRRVR
ncbi:hypothetical protein AU15_07725 [Marinobacter salarius]|uniref:Uncharacterized protein n=1 Tax=Marinobacter salarius TaxID=1420917 RepID=W5YVE8_9GAMM|nr:hypothetical protein AU15_07725 [Marinobacter salarius]